MEQGGQRGGRGGRVSKVWVRALPGSIWESSLAWKHQSGISGLANRRSSHESFASPAQLRRRAGCGLDESPAQLQALPGPLYVIRRHVRRPRATPAAAGNGPLQPCPLRRGAGPAISCPFAPSPAGGTPSDQLHQLSGCTLRWEAPTHGAKGRAVQVHARRRRSCTLTTERWHLTPLRLSAPWKDCSSHHETILPRASWIYSTGEPVQLDTKRTQTSNREAISMNI